MQLNKVSFPKKKTQGNYVAEVIGIAKIAKKTGKFVRLEYPADKMPTRAELLQFCETKGIDSVQALARGIDLIQRQTASGSTSLDAVLFTRLLHDNIASGVKEVEKRAKRLRGIAQSILSMKRTMSKKTLDECYQMVVTNL